MSDKLIDVSVYEVKPKVSNKTGKRYWTLETDQGNLIVFDEIFIKNVVPNTGLYSFETSEFNQTFNSRTVTRFLGSTQGTPAPKPIPQEIPKTSSQPVKQLGNREKDDRITKLALLNTAVHLIGESNETKQYPSQQLLEKAIQLAQFAYVAFIANVPEQKAYVPQQATAQPIVPQRIPTGPTTPTTVETNSLFKNNEDLGAKMAERLHKLTQLTQQA